MGFTVPIPGEKGIEFLCGSGIEGGDEWDGDRPGGGGGGVPDAARVGALFEAVYDGEMGGVEGEEAGEES